MGGLLSSPSAHDVDTLYPKDERLAALQDRMYGIASNMLNAYTAPLGGIGKVPVLGADGKETGEYRDVVTNPAPYLQRGADGSSRLVTPQVEARGSAGSLLSALLGGTHGQLDWTQVEAGAPSARDVAGNGKQARIIPKPWDPNVFFTPFQTEEKTASGGSAGNTKERDRGGGGDAREARQRAEREKARSKDKEKEEHSNRMTF
ncbi:MAG: hypothetical protein LBF92_06465 [Synergistaceae bacterium]|jgi:hypothetical protein|nr:hypothetical protein [Synergistaceae bacterium]